LPFLCRGKSHDPQTISTVKFVGGVAAGAAGRAPTKQVVGVIERFSVRGGGVKKRTFSARPWKDSARREMHMAEEWSWSGHRSGHSEEGGQRDIQLCVLIGTGTWRGRRSRSDGEEVPARELSRRYERGNKWWTRRVVLSAWLYIGKNGRETAGWTSRLAYEKSL
jgi:hypothetical protein